MHSTNFFRPREDDGLPNDLAATFRRVFTPNLERQARLVGLTPHEAVRKWLLFDFSILDEDALSFAICQDPAIDLDDDEMAEEIFGMIDGLVGDGEPLAYDDPDLDDFVVDTLSILRRATQARRRRR